MKLSPISREDALEYLDKAKESVRAAQRRYGISEHVTSKAIYHLDNVENLVTATWDAFRDTDDKYEISSWMFLLGELYYDKMDPLDVESINHDAPVYCGQLRAVSLDRVLSEEIF